MLIDFKNGQTSIVLRVKLRNSSVATGAGLTGLTSASTGLIISTIADNEVSATTYTVAGSTIETISTLGTFAAPTATKCRFKEVDATNHKGVYEIQIADARFAVSSAKSLLVSLSGATNLAECDVVVPLRSLDPYDGVRAGLTALPNAAAAASSGLIINGSNAGTVTLAALTVTAATTLTGNVSMAAGLTITQSTTNGSGISATGNGTGHGMLLTSGSGATGQGLHCVAASTDDSGAGFVGTGNSHGIVANGNGSGSGLLVNGGATGTALKCVAGASGGTGIHLLTSAGDGLLIQTTAGHGVNIAANGTSKHGLFVTGGTAGTSDGVKAVAGTGGVDIRGAITGNVTGTISLTSTYDFAKGTVAMTEAYAANTVAPTPVQALFAIQQLLTDFAISSTSLTVYKLDHTTTAFVVTLDSATVPTSALRT